MSANNEINFENQLLRKAIDGDIQSFEILIKKYEKLLFNIAYRMFSNVDDAKDMTQESLIKIYKNLDKCSDINHFKSWACRITNNTCIDELRKRKGKITDSIDESLQLEESSIQKQLKSNESSPEDEIINKELNHSLQKAINKLSPDQKTLIILRDIQGLSYNELSEVTNTSLGTVKSRLARARLNLRETILKLKEQNKF